MTAPFIVGPPFGFGSGTKGGVMTPVQSGMTPAAGRSLDIPLPEIYPIPEAKEFNPSGTIATAAVEVGTITGATIVIPSGNLGVIRNFTIYISNMVAATNVTYTLLVNGQPQQGYQALSMFPRVSPFVSNGFDCFIRVTGEATITVSFSNIDGGAYTVGAAFGGWYWPQQSDTRWRELGQ